MRFAVIGMVCVLGAGCSPMIGVKPTEVSVQGATVRVFKVGEIPGGFDLQTVQQGAFIRLPNEIGEKANNQEAVLIEGRRLCQGTEPQIVTETKVGDTIWGWRIRC